MQENESLASDAMSLFQRAAEVNKKISDEFSKNYMEGDHLMNSNIRSGFEGVFRMLSAAGQDDKEMIDGKESLFKEYGNYLEMKKEIYNNRRDYLASIGRLKAEGQEITPEMKKQYIEETGKMEMEFERQKVDLEEAYSGFIEDTKNDIQNIMQNGKETATSIYGRNANYFENVKENGFADATKDTIQGNLKDLQNMHEKNAKIVDERFTSAIEGTKLEDVYNDMKDSAQKINEQTREFAKDTKDRFSDGVSIADIEETQNQFIELEKNSIETGKEMYDNIDHHLDGEREKLLDIDTPGKKGSEKPTKGINEVDKENASKDTSSNNLSKQINDIIQKERQRWSGKFEQVKNEIEKSDKNLDSLAKVNQQYGGKILDAPALDKMASIQNSQGQINKAASILKKENEGIERERKPEKLLEKKISKAKKKATDKAKSKSANALGKVITAHPAVKGAQLIGKAIKSVAEKAYEVADELNNQAQDETMR